ncbi:hypothetical protein MMC13_007354 [Lambiella insularis]|nr:hypothetical protein [Lambiella insularis]
MRRVVKGIGSGIGLATEAYAHHKSKSESSSAGEAQQTGQQSLAPPAYTSGESDSEGEVPLAEGDEADWDLDDAAAENGGPSPEDAEGGHSMMSVDHLVRIFISKHPVDREKAIMELPCPVIIPQRRPRDKTRGFVRAYAPVLADCDIDQPTFMDFLKTIHLASKASPVFTVINIAANAVGFVPSPIAMATSTIVLFAVGVAKEVQSRTRSNSFLDQMNEQFFQPRGLYCMIMTYKPESSSSHESVDITKVIQSKMEPSGSTLSQNMKKMAVSSGKTYGEMEMPLAAPLIFPALDDAAAATSTEEQKENALKKGQKFLRDYYDRRAQATYAAENMDSSLSVPQTKEFASRYSDPNHPANSGSLISLVTGGTINPVPRRDDRRLRKAERHDQRRESRSPGGLKMPVTRDKTGRRIGLVRRLLRKDALYLMVVNMPTDEEIAAAREAVVSARSSK